jgi:hypothetical protein
MPLQIALKSTFKRPLKIPLADTMHICRLYMCVIYIYIPVLGGYQTWNLITGEFQGGFFKHT